MAMDADTAVAAGASSSSPSSFHDFAEALSQSKGQSSNALLDSTDGLALLFADVCQGKAENATNETGFAGLSNLANRRITGDEPLSGFLELYEEDENDDTMAWRMEEQTWRLIHLLHAERVQRHAQDPPRLDTASEPYKTPFAVIQDAMERSPALAELKIVRDWLSGNLACRHPVEVRKGYWPFTKNKLRKEAQLAGATSGRAAAAAASSSKGVKSLDPDATTREGSTLELEDAAYEKALNRTLFEYARGGQLNDAIDLARQSDRSWRAASLRGANLYWRPGLDNEVTEGLIAPIGNRNRTLWKAVARSMCAKGSVDEYERALYGALSGDLRSVMQVSTTWDAQLWAHANARLESAIDVHLDNTGNWWSQEAVTMFNLHSDVKDAGSIRLTEMRLPKGDADVSDADKENQQRAIELRDVFVKLAQTEQHGIHLQANHPFRIVQRAVILSELPALLAHVESLLPSMRVTVSFQQYSRLIRFFAHLILYLRLIKWNPMPSDVVCNTILKAYVDILETVNEDELVALYASSLESESATESYAHYLKLMDAREPYDVKQAALLRAQTHDLDLAAVAVTAVRMIFDEVFPSFAPELESTSTSLADVTTAITLAEERLIRAIDWLRIHPSTHLDAIIHVNVLMRLFLNTGRLNAARILLFDLPPEVIEQVGVLEKNGDQDMQAAEFVHWRAFFDALDRHLRYVEVWSRRPLDAGLHRVERHAWTKAMNSIVEEAQAVIMQVLQMDWIKFSAALIVDENNVDPITQQRLLELARIRRIYIPELVLRLHAMLYDARDVVPTALTAVVQLPNLVADERHKLYQDFISGEQNRLKDYLDMIRSAELASLELSSDPFHLANTNTIIV